MLCLSSNSRPSAKAIIDKIDILLKNWTVNVNFSLLYPIIIKNLYKIFLKLNPKAINFYVNLLFCH